MENQDIKEIKSMMKELHEENKTLIEAQFKVIDVKLDAIKSDTAKTNGRVTRLEDAVVKLQIDDRNHIINCPQNVRFEKLQREVDQVVSSKKFILSTVGILSLAVGFIVTLIKIFE